MSANGNHKTADVLNTPCNSPITLDEFSSREAAIESANVCLQSKTAQQRVAWALETLPINPMLSSSFGAHSAVLLHMLTKQAPTIPVVLIDTGYLFAQTYQFIDQLTERLALNLKVFRPRLSPSWQEARSGKRWQNGVAGIDAYNHENKVVPMREALATLQVGTWFAGLRANQSSERAERRFVEQQAGVWKVHPILDWSDKDVFDYFKKHDLPYHPLWERGYVSIGDVHTTRSLHEVDNLSDTRFFGLKRECGIHEIGLSET